VYGFKKGKMSDAKGAFYHPHFHRDNFEDLKNIKRRPKPGERKKRVVAGKLPTKLYAGKMDRQNQKLEQLQEKQDKEDQKLQMQLHRQQEMLQKLQHIRQGQGAKKSPGAEHSDDSTDVDYDLSTVGANDSKSFEDSDKSAADEDNDDSDADGESTNGENQGSTEEDSVAPPPEPKFQPYQKAYARDKDGVCYEAVIRRSMFGINNHKQAQFGLVESSREAEELLKDEEPGWHYFVHYGKWNVNWDRWVPEQDVFEPTEKTKQYAARLIKEHRELQQSLIKKRKGKKSWQTVDGAEFLREWKKRRAVVAAEMEIDKSQDNSAATTDEPEKSDPNDSAAVPNGDAAPVNVAPKRDTWTKAALALELKLREKNLTTKRKQSEACAVVIPLSLKKSLVDQWEIISQCEMMPSLPSTVTVRQTLDKYLESKGIVIETKKCDTMPKADESVAADGAMDVSTDEATNKDSAMDIATDEASKKEDAMNVSTDGASKKNDSAVDESKLDVTADGTAKEVTADDIEAEEFRQGWIDMANGIAMLFDEALQDRLLYQEEVPQLRVLDSIPAYSMTRYSEIYGCEHLLRLFVRLPGMLSDVLTDAETRPILAKVNDLLRFLNKNQPTLFVQSCRKLNELELLEKQKITKMEDRKRKRQESLTAAATVRQESTTAAAQEPATAARD
jgi:hypothetical protein